mmetsp:Transcript_19819/g.49135  ORF Transcript_19819/g.49135 Transcript_19819/m.49135 type:complete len:218 (-) Transcript_19819:1310-1963(-)
MVMSRTASALSSSDRVSAVMSKLIPSKNAESPLAPSPGFELSRPPAYSNSSRPSTSMIGAGSLAMDTSSLMNPQRSSPFSCSVTYASNPTALTTSSRSSPGFDPSIIWTKFCIKWTKTLTARCAAGPSPMSPAGGSAASSSKTSLGAAHDRCSSASPSGCGAPSTHGSASDQTWSLSMVPGPILRGGVLMMRCRLTMSRGLSSTRRYATASLISLRV